PREAGVVGGEHGQLAPGLLGLGEHRHGPRLALGGHGLVLGQAAAPNGTQSCASTASSNVETGPCPGTRRPGATCASGTSTKARSCRCGCGTRNPGSSITASPYSSRSRSSVRGPQGGD